MDLICLEDLQAGQHHEFGDYLVTEEEIIEFAQKYDPQPFHLDQEAGRKSHFGALCASGWLTCSVTMRMLCDHFLLKAASQGSPGIEELKFTKPVFAGDRLSLKVQVTAVRPLRTKPGMGIAQKQIEAFNQNGERVLSMVTNALYLTRAAAEKFYAE